VEEMGRYSVTPSTTPSTTALAGFICARAAAVSGGISSVGDAPPSVLVTSAVPMVAPAVVAPIGDPDEAPTRDVTKVPAMARVPSINARMSAALMAG
jgi:hypothetical protein